MASIRVQHTDIQIETSPVRSILVALQEAGAPIDTQCGGRAMCGRCAVRIVRGEKYLTPMRERENVRLRAIKADPDVRLACQTYSRGDVEIVVLNESSDSSV